MYSLLKDSDSKEWYKLKKVKTGEIQLAFTYLAPQVRRLRFFCKAWFSYEWGFKTDDLRVFVVRKSSGNVSESRMEVELVAVIGLQDSTSGWNYAIFMSCRNTLKKCPQNDGVISVSFWARQCVKNSFTFY